MNQTIEKTTLSNLVFNEDYCRKVLPFIKPEYFDIREERIVFEEITNFVDKYKKMPTKTSLEIEIEHRKDLTEVEHGKVVELIQSLNSDEVDFDWLVDTTEKFCKDKAIYNAVVEVFQSLMEKIRNVVQTLSLVYLLMPWQFHLTMLSAMIILMIAIKGLNIIIK